MSRVLLSFFLLFFSLVSQAQSDSTIVPLSTPPVFSYKKDFKALLDSAQDISSRLYYPVLLTRFLANDSSLTNYEMIALMIGFTENPKYKPLEDMEKENEIYEMTKNGQFVDALAKSLPYLKSHPLSLLVLRETSYAYGRLSRYYEREQIFDTAIIYMDSSNYYMALNDKIMEAMIYSGKGRSPEAPIFALGLADGEHFIPNVGYKIEQTDTEWNRNGDFLEKIKAADNLTAKDFYFVIQHAKQKIDDDKADEMAVKKSKKEKKKEAEKKKEEDKKKEGGSFKSEKPGKKSKGQRTAPVFDDEPSDSSAAPIQNNAEQNQLAPQIVTDTTEKANRPTEVVPSGSNINTTKEEKKKKEADKKKEGKSFKSDKTVKKSKAKRTSPVFDDEPSDSSAVPIQNNAEQNQPTTQTVTDTTGKANTPTAVSPSGDNNNTPKEEEKKKTEETQPAEKPGGN